MTPAMATEQDPPPAGSPRDRRPAGPVTPRAASSDPDDGARARRQRVRWVGARGLPERAPPGGAGGETTVPAAALGRGRGPTSAARAPSRKSGVEANRLEATAVETAAGTGSHHRSPSHPTLRIISDKLHSRP